MIKKIYNNSITTVQVLKVNLISTMHFGIHKCMCSCNQCNIIKLMETIKL